MNKEIAKIVKKAKSDKDILAVILFGSYARGKRYSDIDICLVLKKKLENLKMSKKRLEYLIEFPNLDIRIFQQLPMYIKIRVLKEGKVLLSKDDDLLYNMVFLLIRQYEYYKPIYESYLGVTHA